MDCNGSKASFVIEFVVLYENAHVFNFIIFCCKICGIAMTGLYLGITMTSIIVTIIIVISLFFIFNIYIL